MSKVMHRTFKRQHWLVITILKLSTPLTGTNSLSVTFNDSNNHFNSSSSLKIHFVLKTPKFKFSIDHKVFFCLHSNRKGLNFLSFHKYISIWNVGGFHLAQWYTTMSDIFFENVSSWIETWKNYESTFDLNNAHDDGREVAENCIWQESKRF